MKGPAPKPTAAKILAGNPGRRALNKSEPKYLAAGMNDCPEWLLPLAKDEWNHVAPKLLASGVLTKIDISMLAAYCQTWARWVEAEMQLLESGMVFTTEKGYMMPSPYVSIANTAKDQMRKFAAEYGMTPSSRTRLHTEAPQQEKTTLDALLDGDDEDEGVTVN